MNFHYLTWLSRTVVAARKIGQRPSGLWLLVLPLFLATPHLGADEFNLSESGQLSVNQGRFQLINSENKPIGFRVLTDLISVRTDDSLGVKYDALIGAKWGYSISVVESVSGVRSEGGSLVGVADHSDSQKNLFAAGELNWADDDLYYRVGFWLDSKNDSEVSPVGRVSNRLGFYGDADWMVAGATFKTRLGITNDDQLDAGSFLALTAEYPLESVSLGGGVLQRIPLNGGVSETKQDSMQIDLYARFSLTDKIQLVPSLQLKEIYGLDTDGAITDQTDFRGEVRLKLEF